ncbi:glycosyltransferase family 2 protein [Abiotrophia defectiva]
MKISIVVPVYNVQDYLHYAMESLFQQTHSDYEVILVNDGSTDESGRLCQDYADQYEQVFYYSKPNGGLSDARNFGVAQATGDWVTFLDPDDYLEPYSLELMLALQARYQADLVSTKVAPTKLYKAYSGYSLSESDLELPELSPAQALAAMFYNKSATVSACGKLYRKSMLLAHTFPVGKIYEDFFVVGQHVLASPKVVVSPLVTYHYYQRPGSIVNSGFNKKQYDYFQAVEANRQLIEAFGSEAPTVATALDIKSVAGAFRIVHLMANAGEKEGIQKVRAWLAPYKKQVMASQQVSLQFKVKYLLFLYATPLYLKIRRQD